MGGGGNYGYGYGHGPGMMNGPYYGGGGYGGVQMAQPVDQDAMGLPSRYHEGNYVNGRFDQGVAEARPLGGPPTYQGESLQDAVDRAYGTQRGEEGRTSGQHGQTGKGASSGQSPRDGGGRGMEREGGERKRQGTSGLYTAADHMELEKRRMATQRGPLAGPLPERMDSQDKGGGLPKGKNIFLPNGMAVNIDDATVGMGALGTNQIPYLDLTLRQKAVRDLSVKRKMERERAQGQGWGRGHSRGKGGGKGVYEHPHARGRGQGDRRGSMEICPESANLYRAQLEETVREQEKQGEGAGGAEQVPNAVPGDEDGQEDRAEQERTDSQAHPGADVEMDTRAAAAKG